MSDRAKNPKAEIAAGNPWYTENQLEAALGTEGGRRAAAARWRLLEKIITGWLSAVADGNREFRVLDAGCGDGLDLNVLGRIFESAGRAATLYGCDYNPLRIEKIGANPAVRGVFMASLAEAPIAGASFDVILCNHVIEHIDDPGPALSELGRMLRPGGLLMVGVPNEGCLMAQLRNNLLQRSILRTTDHVHFFTARTLKAAVLRAGLKVDRVEAYGFFSPHLRLHNLLWATGLGRAVVGLLGAIFPGQAADVVCVIEPEKAESGGHAG